MARMPCALHLSSHRLCEIIQATSIDASSRCPLLPVCMWGRGVFIATMRHPQPVRAGRSYLSRSCLNIYRCAGERSRSQCDPSLREKIAHKTHLHVVAHQTHSTCLVRLLLLDFCSCFSQRKYALYSLCFSLQHLPWRKKQDRNWQP